MSNTQSERIDITKLDNGLTVITEHFDFVKSVAIGVWIKIGSRYERVEQAGITHFLEHMLFKGTERRSAFEIVSTIESRGGYMNAMTSNEYTAYYIRCIHSEIDTALDVLSDMVQHASFPEVEITKEKKVVVEEMKMYRDSPDDLVIEEFVSQIFENHPLGRPILGYEETVNNFSRQNLIDFIQEHYAPENIILSVAGNVNHNALVEKAKEKFSQTEKRDRIEKSDLLSPYRPNQKRFTKDIEQTHYVIGKRGLGIDDPDRYKLLVLNSILGGGMSSRLHQNVREKFGYCYSIHTMLQSYLKAGIFGVYVGTDEDYLDHVRELVIAEFEKVQQEKISTKELEDSKTQLKGYLLLGYESMNNRMRRLATNHMFFDRIIPLEEIEQKIEEVTAEDLQNFAGSFLDKNELSETILTPQS
jgi:predicted Zn-dependent peptidase